MASFPKPIRVAFVFNHHFFLGGGERSFALLIKNLDKNTFAPLVIVPARGEIEEYFVGREIPASVVSFASLKKVLKGTPLVSLMKLVGTLRKNRVNIIHANGSRVCFYSLFAARVLGLPVIWHVRETIKDYLFYDAFLALFSNTIICASQSILEKRFRTLLSLIRKKAVVVYNGVDTKAFRQDSESRSKKRRKLGVGDDEILFGVLGNIVSHKGQDFFLKGFVEAMKLQPGLRGKALIMGRTLEENFLEHLHQLILRFGVKDFVIFRDYRPAILDILSSLDVFVLPSQREGFSRSLLEAMSVGLPVVATRLSEIEEAVTEGENALLVDFGNTRQMALHLIGLSEDASLRKRMGERNRLKAVESFDLSLHVRCMENLYKKLVANHP